MPKKWNRENQQPAQRGVRRNCRFWTAAGSEAPRRFGEPSVVRKAVSSLHSATAVQILAIPARSFMILATAAGKR
jgi:hypothetical protein